VWCFFDGFLCVSWYDLFALLCAFLFHISVSGSVLNLLAVFSLYIFLPQLISLEDAPRAYAEFEKGAPAKYIIDPHGMLSKSVAG